MTTDEYSRAAYALLGEGIILLRAHAGEGDVINRYVATVELLQAQRREAAPAPAPDIYTGPVTAGMRFECQGVPFIPDGRRGSKGEFLDASGSGISEPNLRGMYRPASPTPAPDVAPPGFRIVGRSGPGVPWSGKTIRYARRPDGSPANGEPYVPGEAGSRGLPLHPEWEAGQYDILEPIPAEPASPPPAVVPTCKRSCGRDGGAGVGVMFCTPACREARRSLNPPPSDPVTVATAMEAAADFEQTAEEAAAELAADGVDVLAFTARLDAAVTVATGGVPTGYRLGMGWRVSFYKSNVAVCDKDSRHIPPLFFEHVTKSNIYAWCTADAVATGALVPIDTARSVPPGPRCSKGCGVGDAVPAERHRWGCARQAALRASRASEAVPPGPVPVEAWRGVCVCNTGDPVFHAHYSDGKHSCARCNSCDEFTAAAPPPAPDRAPPPYPTSGGTVEPLPDDAAAPPAAPASEPAVRPLSPGDVRGGAFTWDGDDDLLARIVATADRCAAFEAELAEARCQRRVDRKELDRSREDVRQLTSMLSDVALEVGRAVDERNAARAEVEQLRLDAQKGAARERFLSEAVQRAREDAASVAAELEQLKAKLGSVSNEVLRLTSVVAHQAMEVADARAEATARVRSMRDDHAEAVRTLAHAHDTVTGRCSRCAVLQQAARAIRALPLDTGTATDTGGEAGIPSEVDVKRAEREAQRECRHCWHSKSDADADNHDATCCQCSVRSTPTSQMGITPEQVRDYVQTARDAIKSGQDHIFDHVAVYLGEAQADAIKAAVVAANNRAANAFHLRQSNNDSPFDDMTPGQFEAWLRSGEDAPGAVGK